MYMTSYWKSETGYQLKHTFWLGTAKTHFKLGGMGNMIAS
jgi:hypothetical protein